MMKLGLFVTALISGFCAKVLKRIRFLLGIIGTVHIPFLFFL